MNLRKNPKYVDVIFLKAYTVWLMQGLGISIKFLKLELWEIEIYRA